MPHARLVKLACAVLLLPESATVSNAQTSHPDSYTRYSAFACAMAPARMSVSTAGQRKLTWRDRWPDTVLTMTPADSVVMAAAHNLRVAETRQCLAKHPVATALPYDLFGIGLAWLSADDTAQAASAFRRLLSVNAHAPVAERGWLLQQLVGTYASGDDAWLKTAMGYMKQLDALGPPVTGYRVAARNALFGVAWQRDSIPFMQEQAEIALRTSRELTGDAAHEWIDASVGAAINQAETHSRRGDNATAIQVLTQAVSELGKIEGRVVGTLRGQIGRYKLYGTPAPPLQTTFTFAAGDTVPSTVTPPSGKVSIRVFFDFRLFERAMDSFIAIQRLVAHAGDKVDVVIITETRGDDGTLFVPKAADEAKIAAQFFHTYLQMPATVAVWAQSVTGKEDDGRIQRDGNPNRISTASAIVIDKHGKIRDTQDIGTGSLRRLLHLIDEYSQEP